MSDDEQTKTTTPVLDLEQEDETLMDDEEPDASIFVLKSKSEVDEMIKQHGYEPIKKDELNDLLDDHTRVIKRHAGGKKTTHSKRSKPSLMKKKCVMFTVDDFQAQLIYDLVDTVVRSKPPKTHPKKKNNHEKKDTTNGHCSNGTTHKKKSK